MNDFSALGLAPALLSALDARKLTDPTPIQQKAIPLVLEGHDVMGLAQTGTGKTLAFGLPLLDQLIHAEERPRPRLPSALILAPTRELVNQIAESLRDMTGSTNLRIVTVVGGASINRQVNALARPTDVLVATPGRLIDLLDRRALELSQVRFLVLDEADQMLDMGFIHSLRKIAPLLATPRQTMLFSATMPKLMEELSQAYLNNPMRVQVAPPGKAADKITQSIHFVEKAGKPRKLREILDRDPGALTLVFSRTKHGAERLMKGLVADGYNADSIHGNKSQGKRDRAITAFRDGKINVLVATDVAARGIDIPGVAYVVNFDLPDVPDNYVHRIGRTARAGREGEAIAFCSEEEVDLLKQIEKLMKMEIPTASGDRPAHASPRPQRRRGGGGGKPQGNRRGNGGAKGKGGNGSSGGGSSQSKWSRGPKPSKPGGTQSPKRRRPNKRRTAA
ncbi:MAG: DEAD/DEAH box helicase [Oceanicola sp.]|nr:DEAD/DEAH box helicase [Oceanicola sp.]